MKRLFLLIFAIVCFAGVANAQATLWRPPHPLTGGSMPTLVQDLKISQLTALSSATSDDLLVIVNDPGGTPVTRKITVGSLFGSILGNVVVTAASNSTATFSVRDSSTASIFAVDTTNGRVTFNNAIAGGGQANLILGSGAGLFLPNSGVLSFSSNGGFASSNVVLQRDDSSGILAQRSGTTAQIYRIYETYTDASNYKRLVVYGSGTIFIEGAGTGSGGNTLSLGTATNTGIDFYTNNTRRWGFSNAGHLLTLDADNAYDIGASGANRPRHLYVGSNGTFGSTVSANIFTATSSLITGAAGYIYWTSRSVMNSPSDGVIKLANQAETDFNRIQFGGTSTAFSGISLSASVGGHAQGLIIQRADGTPQVFANLGAATNGSVIYCSDCTKATPCAGSGTGAIAKRINGSWDCD